MSRTPVLEMRNIAKAFGKFYALKGVDLTVWPGDQLTHFMLAFAAKRAVQQFARTIFAFICHESKPLLKFFVPQMTTQMPFSGASRDHALCRPVVKTSIAAPLRHGHQLRWVKMESTRPYSTASDADRKRSRSVSRSICSRD